MDAPISYQLIDTPAALKRAVEVLSGATSLAFDLEFDSNFRRYGVTLCLIQVATPGGEVFLIDPMARLDLAPLYAIFEDAAILKLVHSPGEDLRLLHSLGCFPHPLWDTEIPARLLNYEQTSLSAMLEAKLGVVLSGKQQRSNWLKRPLEESQLVYAAADAVYLHPLKAVLDEEVAAKGLGDLLRDEQTFLAAQRYEPASRTHFLKAADERSLSPWQQHVLNGLLAARDAIARARNRPAFQVADDKPIRDLVYGSDAAPESLLRHSLAGPFRTEEHVDRLVTAYETSVKEATDRQLSTARPPRERVSQKVRLDRDRLFVPVQAALAERYGLYAARFLLSNGAVGDVLEGKKTLATLGSPERIRIIREMAAALRLDLGGY